MSWAVRPVDRRVFLLSEFYQRRTQPARKGRNKLSCDPDIAADLVVTFTRGLAVMERAYRNPQHLETMSQQFVRILLPEAKGRRGP
jgi:hypothetical protein